MKTRSKQQGYALLLFVIVLAIAAAAVTVKALKHRSGYTQIARDRITADALAQAKDALIGYAITYGDTHPGNVHGYLPCPDQAGVNPEGSAETDCGGKNISSIGKIPWRTLDLSSLRSGDGECLWYAVSGTYKNNTKTDLMNWDNNGQLQVYASDGTTLLTPAGTTLLTPADNQAVAVIFAPGTAAPDQIRALTTNTSTCGDNYTASNYLDNDTVHLINNADIATGKFIQSHEDRDPMGNIILTVNDRMVFITKQDIWNAMKKREAALMVKLDTMTLQVAQCIANFGKKNALSGNQSLPWPTRLTLSDYGDTASYYDRKNLYAGRVPYQVDISRLKTGNTISSDYLLTQGTCDADHTHCVNNCPIPDAWAAIYPWWYNWKEHLFYAVSQRFQPDNDATNPVCDNDHQCLSVNGSGKYAAVVIFAGKPLSSQTRTDKSIISNYLEGLNNSNMAGFANGNEDYQAADITIPPSTTFNDIVYCIKENLSVVKGTTAGCP